MTMLRTESMTALAAEAADDAPRASMIWAPRCCTVVMNSPRSHSMLSMTSTAGLPSMAVFSKSGNCVDEWLPQMAMPVTDATGAPALRARRLRARFWSRRVMAKKRSSGISGAWARAMRQLVLHGLPTTTTRTSEAAWAAMASPWGPKIPPLMVSRSLRSMPALRGTDPTSSAHDVPSKAVFRSEVASMPTNSGKAQSSSSITTPWSAPMAGSISSRRSTTGWSGPSIWPDAMRNSSE